MSIKLIETKATVNEMSNTLDGAVGRLGVAEEKISELQKTIQNEIQRKKLKKRRRINEL